MNAFIVYGVLGLIGGVFYCEFTKLNGFTSFTTLSVFHTHYLMLGVFHGGGATQSMKIEPPNPFGQSHAIHCSEPLNPRREPLQFMKLLSFFI